MDTNTCAHNPDGEAHADRGAEHIVPEAAWTFRIPTLVPATCQAMTGTPCHSCLGSTLLVTHTSTLQRPSQRTQVGIHAHGATTRRHVLHSGRNRWVRRWAIHVEQKAPRVIWKARSVNGCSVPYCSAGTRTWSIFWASQYGLRQPWPRFTVSHPDGGCASLREGASHVPQFSPDTPRPSSVRHGALVCASFRIERVARHVLHSTAPLPVKRCHVLLVLCTHIHQQSARAALPHSRIRTSRVCAPR